LPGCYSQGETIDELKRNIRETIAGVLEVLKERGRSRLRTFRLGTLPFEIDHRSRYVLVDRGDWMHAPPRQMTANIKPPPQPDFIR
jgi:hypothetical protein